MNAIQLLNHCRALGIRLWTESGDLCVDAPRATPNAWLVAQLSDHKAELLGLLDRDGSCPPRREAEGRTVVAPKGRLCPSCGSSEIALIPGRVGPHWARLRCLGCSRHVGWAPTPHELVGDLWIFPFGKYRGRSLREVAEVDLEYIKWGAWSCDKPRVQEVCRHYLEQREDNHDDARIA